jgi:hypothetical protein
VYEVRHLIADIMYPPEPIWHHLISPDLPGALLHDPDVNRIVRRSGGTVTVYDGPLTEVGSRRIRRWQQEWLALPRPATPVVIAPDGAVLPRLGALRTSQRPPAPAHSPCYRWISRSRAGVVSSQNPSAVASGVPPLACPRAGMLPAGRSAAPAGACPA